MADMDQTVVLDPILAVLAQLLAELLVYVAFHRYFSPDNMDLVVLASQCTS
jgi:hypothetical protein